jgi:hypothetical protein
MDQREVLVGKKSRTKGRGGELEVKKLFEAAGWPSRLLYGQEEEGGEKGDLENPAGYWEIKRRHRIPLWLKPKEKVRGVLVREDHGEWLVVVRMENYIELLQADHSWRKQ